MVVLIAALTAGGCSDDADGSADPSRSSPTAGDASSRAAPPSAAPTPTRYTDRQLGAALPEGRTQLHGITEIAVECRDLAEPCNGARGWGLVDARSDPSSRDLVVSINRTHRPSVQRAQERRCPDGPVHIPLEWTDRAHTSYRPGERAEARRLPLTIGEWSGFVCQKTGVLLWPEGETSERHTWQEAYLTNGVHDLATSGRTLPLTKALVREYLARLTVGAGLGTG